MKTPVLLTVRGTLNPKSLEEARALHNATAGSPQGIATARGLSDLSHTVYAPCPGAGALSNTRPGELLFIDTWADPAGLQQFFANPGVQEAGSKLFAQRDGSVWMPARGGFSFHVPPTAARPPRFVGLFRARVQSPEAAVEAFSAMVLGSLSAARGRGLLSHDLFVRLGAPTDPVEILGLDLWGSVEGLKEHYQDPAAMTGLDKVLAGPPEASVWEQAQGFSEW
jgi:quinol monooxygenase YgiN